MSRPAPSTAELARRPLMAPTYVAAVGSPRGFDLLDDDRSRGLLLAAGSGSGKSLGMGYLAFSDLVRWMPQVVFDPHGTVIDALLIRLAQVPAQLQPQLWRRIRYVDMRGRGEHFVPWPALFELPGDSRKDVADRFLQALKAIDPHLVSASVQGWNRLYKVGLPVGIVLASLDLQLSEAHDLLRNPGHWIDRLDMAATRHPEARRAVEFFREEYLPLPPDRRQELASTYLNKLDSITMDPASEDFFCARGGGIDLAEVVDRRLTVLLDFRGETNADLRVLKTRWAFDTIMAFVKHRGPGKHVPLAIHFDELTELTNQVSLEHDLFSREIDYLFNVIQRNYSCYVTAALQHLWQVGERTQQTLLSLGTHMFGTQSSMQVAERISRRYADLDPMRPKRVEPIWMMGQEEPFIVDYRDVDFPLEEQAFLAARGMLRLPPFTFLVKPHHSTRLQLVSMQRYMGAPWPNEHLPFLARLRVELSARTGQRRARQIEAPMAPIRQGRPDRMEATDEQFYDAKPERR